MKRRCRANSIFKISIAITTWVADSLMISGFVRIGGRLALVWSGIVSPALSRRETGFGQLTLQNVDCGPHHIDFQALFVALVAARIVNKVVVADALAKLRKRSCLVRRQTQGNRDSFGFSHGNPPS